MAKSAEERFLQQRGEPKYPPHKCANPNSLRTGIVHDLYDDSHNIIFGQSSIPSNHTGDAMEECCGDNEIKISKDNCALICELPEELREEMKEEEEDGWTVFHRCMERHLPEDEAVGITAGSSLEDLKKVEDGGGDDDDDESGASLVSGVPVMSSLYLLMILLFFFQRR